MNRDPEGNVWPAAHRRAGPPRCRSDCLSDLLLGVKTDCSSTQRPLCFNTDAIGGAAQPTPHTVSLTTQSRQVGWWKHWTNNSLCWKSLLPVCVRDRWLNKTEDVSAVPVAVPEGTFYRFCLRTKQNRTEETETKKQNKNKNCTSDWLYRPLCTKPTAFLSLQTWPLAETQETHIYHFIFVIFVLVSCHFLFPSLVLGIWII